MNRDESIKNSRLRKLLLLSISIGHVIFMWCHFWRSYMHVIHLDLLVKQKIICMSTFTNYLLHKCNSIFQSIPFYNDSLLARCQIYQTYLHLELIVFYQRLINGLVGGRSLPRHLKTFRSKWCQDWFKNISSLLGLVTFVIAAWQEFFVNWEMTKFVF